MTKLLWDEHLHTRFVAHACIMLVVGNSSSSPRLLGLNCRGFQSRWMDGIFGLFVMSKTGRFLG